MRLAPGTKLGPYEILALVGAGGMGEVYRAQDTRLERSVAVKVLVPQFADGSDRRARFEREAKAISAINHPHICTLHDVGRQDGIDYIVMEFVEGETLADRLKKGPLPIEQGLRHAIDIADALARAHRLGVIHRDLKPGNVMLTKAGAKLMDFGLAKRAAVTAGGDDSVSPTEQAPITGQGTLLGTLPYMAPEQLEGKEADARSDLWALGCLLYEMATGRRAFDGRSQASLIGAIMTTEPRSLSELQPLSPPALERLVKACLAKDPDERLQTAHDVRQELKWITEATSGDAVHRSTSGRGKGLALAGLALVVGFVLGGLALHWAGSAPAAAAASTTVHATIPITTVQVDNGGQYSTFSISPDGRLVVVREGGQLHLRPLSDFSTTPLAGTDLPGFPTFSPDGSALAFLQSSGISGGAIKRLAVEGGPVVDVMSESGGTGLSWGEDDWIYFSAGLGGGGIWRVPSKGGTAEPVTRVDEALGESAHTYPQLLPGGKALIFTALGPSGGSEDSRVATVIRESGERRILVERAMFGRYLATGHLLYASNAGTVFAQAFDPERLELNGEAVPVLSGVETGTWGGGAFLSVSRNGNLVFLRRSARPARIVRVVDANGKAAASPFQLDTTTMAKLGTGAGAPVLSPDGQRLAFTGRAPGQLDIWLLDARTREVERLTFDPAEDEYPAWSPEGRAVAYTSAQSGTTRRLFVKDVDSGAQPRLLRTWPRHVHITSWSRDGRWLTAYDYTATQSTDIWAIPVDAGDPIAVANGPAREISPQFSPDGRWIAYSSNESGRAEIYVVAFPALNARWQVSTTGGAQPHWDSQGRTLYYLQAGALMAQEVSPGAEFVRGRSRRLFEARAFDFQVASGERFILSEDNQAPPDAPLQLIVNWFPELTSKFRR